MMDVRLKIAAESLLKKSQGHAGLYLLTGILSALVFILIYGVHILNPTYTDWILNAGGDPSQHYLGWVAYRNSSWSFPIGMTDGLLYPYSKSIIFTDSIPLLAVFFKILSPLLPASFQYFGIWGIGCFILQGILAARILVNFTKNKTAVVLSSLLFVLAPVMLYRMYVHTSLAGQWLILLALEPLFHYSKYRNNKKIIGLAALLGVLSVSVHMYYVLMCGIIVVGICILELACNRRQGIKKAASVLMVYLLAAFFVVAILGGFSSGMVGSDYGLGINSFNLNAFFNPQSWSQIFKNLPLYGDGQYEGFAYLGAGVILLLILAVFMLINCADMKEKLINHRAQIIVILIVFVLSIVAALSPVITLGENVLLEIPLPEIVINIWSIFRSSGRISWVAVYIIYLCACIIMFKTCNQRTILAAVAAALLLQVYDFHNRLISMNENYNQVISYDWSIKEEDLWIAVGEDTRYEHVVFVDTFENDDTYLRWMGYADWALSYDMTVSNFYFARSVEEESEEVLRYALENLPEDAVYLFAKETSLRCLCYDLYYYETDDVIVGCTYPLDGYETTDTGDFYNVWTFGDNYGLSANGGQDSEEGREIYPDGWSWGPFWELAEGEYIVEITGEGLLEQAEILMYSDGGAKTLEYEILEASDERIVYSLTVDEYISGLEIPVHNDSDESVWVYQILIRQK